MIIVYLCYEIDFEQFDVFIEYGCEWICFVIKFGGMYYGYFLFSEGDSDEVFVLFIFFLFVEYEVYWLVLMVDFECFVVFEFVCCMWCICCYECCFFMFFFS